MHARNAQVLIAVLNSHSPGRVQLPPGFPDDTSYIDFRTDEKPLQRFIGWIDGGSPFEAESIGTYYRDIVDLEGDGLRNALGRILKRGHKPIVYRTPRNVAAVYDLFSDPDIEGNIIRFVDQVSIPAFINGRRIWHMDQIWPRAYGFRHLRDVQGDLHNIVPADPHHNIRERGADGYYDEDLDKNVPKNSVALEPLDSWDPRDAIARA